MNEPYTKIWHILSISTFSGQGHPHKSLAHFLFSFTHASQCFCTFLVHSSNYKRLEIDLASKCTEICLITWVNGKNDPQTYRGAPMLSAAKLMIGLILVLFIYNLYVPFSHVVSLMVMLTYLVQMRPWSFSFLKVTYTALSTWTFWHLIPKGQLLAFFSSIYWFTACSWSFRQFSAPAVPETDF